MKRRRKLVHTITKNKETINQRLETNCMTEPTFAKLNSIVGDSTSSHRLMNYILPTVQSELLHQTNLPFWNAITKSAGTMEEMAAPDGDILIDKLDVSETVNIEFDSNELNNQIVLRPQQSAYQIIDAPADDES